jgi:hypothetical protein
MFCPKCAASNTEGAKFCRSCGADISLVPDALTGQLQVTDPDEVGDDGSICKNRKRGKQPSLEGGIKRAFMGLAFLFVALALFYTGQGRYWWYWMLIPAFSMLGGGVAEYIRWRNAKKEIQPQSSQMQATMRSAPLVNQLRPRSTSELVPPPPSVTEGTTRHLGAEAPTKIFVPADRPK